MGRGEGGVGGRERAEAGRRGETLWRLRRAPPPTPQPDPHAPALHAVAHISLEARVGPRLEQRLDAGSAAVENRAVQRSVLVLPKRGGGPTQVAERRWRVGGCLWRVQAPFAPLPACMRAGRPRAGSRQRGRQRGAAAEGRSGASGAPPARGAAGQRRAASPAHSLTPHPSPPRRSRAAAHIVLGIHVGALGDEVLEAVELAVVSRPHEGRVAVLRRRGGGAKRGERWRGGRGSRGGGRQGQRARGGGDRGRLTGRRSPG